MLGYVRRITRTVNRTFTALSRWTRGSTPPTNGSSTSRIQMGWPHTTPIARSQEEMQTWQTILPREDNLTNEEYLGQVEEALRRQGIQYGQPSSLNPHPSPNSSPESNMSSHTSGPLNSEIWSMQQTVNGPSPLLCSNPDLSIFLASPSPFNNGPKQISLQ
uniref:C3 n=1 Tax=Euphorbia caput-medusae latent virus TaxID=1853865 RepID=A0A166V3Y5_9GEMI|nr:C3 [Euphorbia caput-medusae latent virus]